MRINSRMTSAIVLLVAAVSSGCAAKRVWVPPRIDLAPYRPVGLVTFTIENARGDLNLLATERFASEVFSGQDQVEILELGDAERVLRRVRRQEFNGRTARAIGNRFDVPAVFVGHIKVSSVSPRLALFDGRFPRAEATVAVEISVRLYSTESGATVWSNSARLSQTVGELGVADGQIIFGAEDPNEAYGQLVDQLIYDLTYDFRPAYVRQ